MEYMNGMFLCKRIVIFHKDLKNSVISFKTIYDYENAKLIYNL